MFTRPRTRIWLAGTISAVALVAGSAYVFRWMSRRPLYTPGMVREGQRLRGPLEPPDQKAGDAPWRVERDVALHHFAQGSGRRVLVLHGGPGVPFATPIAALASLATDHQFVYYDQRGCGRSTRPIQSFSSRNFYANLKTLDGALGIGAQIADVERIRRILGEEKLVLFGHSYGGFLAALYAAEFPERVAALVLVAPADLLTMPPAGGGLFGEVRAALPAALQPDYDAYLRRYLDFGHLFARNETELAALQAEFGRYYGAAAQAAGFSPPPATEAGSIGGWMPQAQYLSMGRTHDYRTALGAVQSPVLVIHGGRDLQPAAASRQYAALFPHAELVTIAGAGHFAFVDRPEELARVVGAFLARTEPARAVAGGGSR